MLNIGSFFEKFKNATLKEMMLRQSVIDAVFANINPQIAKAIKIELKDVELKNKIIKIGQDSLANEIHFLIFFSDKIKLPFLSIFLNSKLFLFLKI